MSASNVDAAAAKITASYASPGTQQQLSIALKMDEVVATPGEETHPSRGKTLYLAALRQATTELQSQVNTLLTQMMEKDAAQNSLSGNTQAKKHNEDKAEEMYGEEEADDEG